MRNRGTTFCSVFFSVYGKLKDRKRSMGRQNDHNALWHLRNSYNTKFRVVAVFKQPQRVVACEDMPWCESGFVAVKGNDHNLPKGQLASVSSVSHWSSCKLVVFTATSVDSVKKIFNDKVKELNDASNNRSLFLDNEGYNNILREVKEAQTLRKNNQPLTSKHYRRFKRYDVMKIGDMQKLAVSGSGENYDSNIRYYCKT